MWDFVQPSSGMLIIAAFFLMMLRVHARLRGHAGYQQERAPALVRAEADVDHAATTRPARHHGRGCHSAAA